MSNFKKYSGSLYPVLCFTLVNLFILSLSRFGLAFWQQERVGAVHGWLPLFVQGIRIDIVSLCWLFGIFALFSVLLISDNRIGRFYVALLRIVLTAGSVFILFMELVTPEFIETYDFRPNRLFIEYLVNPKEVFTMLANGHLLALVAVPALTALAAWFYWRLAKKVTANLSPFRWRYRPLIALLVIALVFLGARSSLQHRGINPAMVAFSSDPLVNSLVLNSGYSLLYAAQQLKDEDKSSEIYGKMAFDEVLETIKSARGRADSEYLSSEIPTLTYNQASYQGKPKNIVIILEESLGAQFIGSLNGKPLSPHFDQLAQQGWLFENLYATGTRSVRGIEAVTSGFTPTPARAVVKLSGSQHGFFTIAELLQKQGYHTSFIYGGEKHFDNMASFFYGNGFQTIIDQADYKNPKFVSTWGMSDEDLFDKANQQFSEWQKSGQPFFSLVFTSSNHDPFEFPDNKIELYEQPKQTRNNAAKYADFALGYFFEMAKKSDYWQDTIFLVVADHDSRVSGASLVPIRHFHIPALILGEGIEAKRDPRLVSQIDLPTTLLSLAGISGEYPMLGYDLTRSDDPNRALMQFDKTMAYMQGDQVAILQPNSEAKGFRYDQASHSLIATEIDPQLKKTALAYALWGSHAYKNRLYKSAVQEKK
ncbi:Phosphoglycerol transferase MdoB [Pasteurella testudinis DSM 23072]|uniref:Phosphoglycerol transferase MdoB n=1 Tax=Pasteurella testudinis DSM 23072 TaxID=1122938 RepID=A0A1W1UYY0_9PAST|nr:LTA synthase family protein [Pasteurella testudinis]SMB85951.1 Phosphoglycerol transferase MdoB [Pasteurella testudinis DSM 23072]SUB51506.1 phosphoglycerol transferase [Pasteurella testudinis]